MDINKTRLAHIGLHVPNMQNAINFYTKVMNFEISERYKSPHGDIEFVFVSNGEVTYELIENPALATSSVDHIAYESEDIQASFDHFNNINPECILSGIGFIDFVFENGVKFFFISGGGGEKIEFYQRL